MTDQTKHECTAINCPPFCYYYVSAIDGGRTYLMAGPYRHHSEALANVDKALRIANEKDASGRAWFMHWGTVRMQDGATVGILNKHNLI